MRILPESLTIEDIESLLNEYIFFSKTPLIKGTSDYSCNEQIILSMIRLVVLQNEYTPVVNVDSLGRSIHYININQNILDRVRLVVSLNDAKPVVNVVSLGRSIH